MRLARLSVLSDNRTFPSNKPLFHIIQLNDYNWANEDFVELGREAEETRAETQRGQEVAVLHRMCHLVVGIDSIFSASQ